MEYYIVQYVDGRIKSGYFWTDGQAWQFAKDYSLGYPFKITAFVDFDDEFGRSVTE